MVFVALCFMLPSHEITPQLPVTMPTGASFVPIVSSIVIAIQAVINTYDGWYAPFFFTEEDRDPSRDLPWSVFFGTLSIVAIYGAWNLALLDVRRRYRPWHTRRYPPRRQVRRFRVSLRHRDHRHFTHHPLKQSSTPCSWFALESSSPWDAMGCCFDRPVTSIDRELRPSA